MHLLPGRSIHPTQTAIPQGRLDRWSHRLWQTFPLWCSRHSFGWNLYLGTTNIWKPNSWMVVDNATKDGHDNDMIWGVPKMDGLQWKTLVKCMIWRYPFLGGEHPYKSLAFASFVTSDIGSIIDFKQVCLQLFISGRFAQQSAEADSSGELGNGAMCYFQ